MAMLLGAPEISPNKSTKGIPKAKKAQKIWDTTIVYFICSEEAEQIAK